MRSGMPRSAAMRANHGPAQIASRCASTCVPSASMTRTPASPASQPAAATPKRSSAPCAAASIRCACTPASGNSAPATASYTPISSSRGVIAGKCRRSRRRRRPGARAAIAARSRCVPATTGVSGRPTKMPAGLRAQRGRRARRERVPQRVRAPQQRHVLRRLEIRLANDARAAVRRAARVRGPELLDAEHAHVRAPRRARRPRCPSRRGRGRSRRTARER